MIFKKYFASAAGVLAFGLFLGSAQKGIESKTIDGVPQVLNPAQPIKGTIRLDIERLREIDPYAQLEVGMKMVLFSRSETGSVILFDPNGAEAHRFGPDGKYLGLLTKKGQGPGEFSPMQGYRAFFYGTEIWVYGGRKVAHLDRNGKFLEDRVLKNSLYAGVDAGRFLAMGVTWNERKTGNWTLKLVDFDMKGAERTVDLLSAENIREIHEPNGQGGFGDEWGTPDFFFAGDPANQRVYCGLNTEYKILVKDYSGKDRLVIQKAHETVKVKREDVAKMMPWVTKQDQSKWILSAYPDRYVALKDVLPLPGGFLAAYRITGPKLFEIDIFSPKGEFLYTLILPPDVNMARAQFLAGGFATVESSGDSYVYREYRIKNMPEVFGK